MRFLSIAVLVLVLLLAPLSSSALTWLVPSQCLTIKAGMDSAVAGDTVLVACGTYYEHDIVVPSGITLRSETGQLECVTIDAQQQGSVITCEAGLDTTRADTTRIEGVTVTGGYTDGSGGGIVCEGYYWEYRTLVQLSGCNVVGNAAWVGGGVKCHEHSNVIMTGCTLAWNSAGYTGGGLDCFRTYDNPILSNCTFYGNSASWGGGIWSWYCGLALKNTIIAYGTEGEAVACLSGVTVTCSDIYGNAGGDWVGCIEDQYGVAGNIGQDPLFCDPEAGDFTLCTNSPCAPEYNPDCGLIGAWDVGCGTTATVPSTWGLVKGLFRLPGE